MKKIAIIQSGYIPWKGYFDIINSVDEFVLYDDVQYTKRDWRNRNLIHTADGLQWLSIPVKVKGKYNQKTIEAEVADNFWPEKHWNRIRHNYSKAPCFDKYSAIFKAAYEEAARKKRLTEINCLFISLINRLLGIQTCLTPSGSYRFEGEPNEKLITICKSAGAETYLTGPAAMEYLNVTMFHDEGIEVEWMDYSDYPEYPHFRGSFYHNVSILDLLFNMGERAPAYMLSF